ncbi:unnamed protein product [Rotaria sp. Silwood1]|nr:unnamed protein product [Rotaria sp. Silwood1]
MTSTNSTGRKSKRDDSKRSSAPITIVVSSEQQITKVPLSERLSAFESQTSTGQLNIEQKQQNLSADSLVTLLTQGLQSSDTTLLDVS